MDFIEVLYAAKIEPEIFQNRHLHKRQALVQEEATVSNILARTFPLQIKHQTRRGMDFGHQSDSFFNPLYNGQNI